MTTGFYLNPPNGKAITAMTHTDNRNFVQRIFQNFDQNSGEVKTKQILPIDCTSKPASEQYAAELRKQQPQIWMNHNGKNCFAVPVPDAMGRTSTILIPLEDLVEFGQTLAAYGEKLPTFLDAFKAATSTAAEEATVEETDSGTTTEA